MIPPIKYHGGKHYLVQWLLTLRPQKALHVVETHFGAGAFLLARNPVGTSEVVNDIWGLLINFWRVLQDPKLFKLFLRRIEATPFSEFEWHAAKLGTGPPPQLDVDAAVAFFIRARQSRQGLFKDFATLSRNRTRRGMNEQVSAWLTAIEGLPDVHGRLKRVVILNRDANEVIRSQDGPNTLFYCDPPYLQSTRTAPNAYTHEMTREQHQQLLSTINACKGMVMLSGYRNPLYDRELRGWNRHDKAIDNKASGASTKRIVTESVWCNY